MWEAAKIKCSSSSRKTWWKSPRAVFISTPRHQPPASSKTVWRILYLFSFGALLTLLLSRTLRGRGVQDGQRHLCQYGLP